MMSLWSLLTPRARMRRFALLDAMGNCRALREASEMPGEDGWVEVNELRPQWLGQRLPTGARVAAAQQAARTRRALAA
ncbi:hypothetical protein [Pseudomonas sp. Gutcm_11s]|uniref:hypothetical protein n=1 Tax=Pseudomonas sp. Gutcm_11s TaxID=3026088 RepID=UPI002361397D|nr:hypothetical protein [Pseudomonas sp. Gutcm_11s]MDD0841504.1 hypothetical protein [Pseudomonas sp. Gutcm_11s]